MKKPIGKMNKKELLEFVKECKDTIKTKDVAIFMTNETILNLESRISDLTDRYRILKAEYEIDKKVLKRYYAQKQLLKDELEQGDEQETKKVGFLRNLFS